MAKAKANAPSAQPAGMKAAVDLRNKLAAHLHDIEIILQSLQTLAKPELPASKLAHLFGVVRDMRDMASEVFSPLFTKVEGGDLYGLLSKDIVPKSFERENLSSFTTQDGYRVTVSEKYYASIAGDKDAAYEWLRENKLGDLIQPTVNASTLSAAGKALLEEGKELPEPLFKCFLQPGTSLTRTKK